MGRTVQAVLREHRVDFPAPAMAARSDGNAFVNTVHCISILKMKASHSRVRNDAAKSMARDIIRDFFVASADLTSPVPRWI
jgi:hypothetical protein